tara:strand:+ start:19482 stop:20792 length:1311 start_codon:yes stop_codon:yes gene_type:complete
MLPVVVIVGRPNVGKSTLFNRLTRTKNAIVDDQPGITRDRMHGIANFDGKDYLLVDTGGMAEGVDEIDLKVAYQVEQALDEADVIIFLTDCRSGSLSTDLEIAQRLREAPQTVFVAVNKTEGLEPEIAVSEFHELGLGKPFPISARKGSGVQHLIKSMALDWPKADLTKMGDTPRVAIIGRPNVGKSTLVNSLLGDQRMIVADVPGTTRDSVSIPCVLKGEKFTLVDTAGVRRKSRVKESIERYSEIRTLQAIAGCNVVILVLDSYDGIAQQDKAIAGLVIQYGRAIVLAVNKWDKLDSRLKTQLDRALIREYSFLPVHDSIKISALYGRNLGSLIKATKLAHKSAIKNLPTGQLNRALADAVKKHPPQRTSGRLAQLKYAHQGGRNPLIVVIHGNSVSRLSPSYKKYLAKYFARSFNLIGCPVRIETRASVNPYN